MRKDIFSFQWNDKNIHCNVKSFFQLVRIIFPDYANVSGVIVFDHGQYRFLNKNVFFLCVKSMFDNILKGHIKYATEPFLKRTSSKRTNNCILTGHRTSKTTLQHLTKHLH